MLCVNALLRTPPQLPAATLKAVTEELLNGLNAIAAVRSHLDPEVVRARMNALQALADEFDRHLAAASRTPEPREAPRKLHSINGDPS